MANPFDVQPVNVLQGIMMQREGAQAAYDAALKPLQVAGQVQGIQARNALQGMLSTGETPDYNQVAAKFLAAGGDPQTAATFAGIANQQAQRKLQERGLDIQEAGLREKPSYQTIEDEQGNKRLVRIDPLGGAIRDVTPQFGGQQAGAPPVPPGMNAKEYRLELAKRAAGNEEETVKSAQAAAEFKPFIDQAVQAYEQAIQAGAVGPIAANPVARLVNQYTVGTNAEIARQNYDQALHNVQVRVTAAQNKGEGAVSNYERQLYGAQFPDLQALDPVQKLQYLKQIQANTDRSIEAAKGSPLAVGSAAGRMQRPSVFGPQGAPNAGPQQAPPAGVPVSQPPDIRAQAQDAIARGADPRAVAQRLLQHNINPDELGLSWSSN